MIKKLSLIVIAFLLTLILVGCGVLSEYKEYKYVETEYVITEKIQHRYPSAYSDRSIYYFILENDNEVLEYRVDKETFKMYHIGDIYIVSKQVEVIE